MYSHVLQLFKIIAALTNCVWIKKDNYSVLIACAFFILQKRGDQVNTHPVNYWLYNLLQ